VTARNNAVFIGGRAGVDKIGKRHLRAAGGIAATGANGTGLRSTWPALAGQSQIPLDASIEPIKSSALMRRRPTQLEFDMWI